MRWDALNDALARFRETARRFPLSPAPRNGAARVLRYLGAIQEARDLYEQVASQFPANPAAHIGLAEVERSVGSLRNAADAYRALLRRFPRIKSIGNGLAAVLAASGKYAEARDLLPDRLPASQSDWVAYHIRGVIQLRSGNLTGALQTFEHGLAHTPWFIQRSFFRTSLASLAIRREQHQKALDLLEVESAPSLEPIAELIRIHAQGALGRRDDVQASVRASMTTARSPILIELRDTLSSRFGSAEASEVPTPDEALFLRECDALLLAA